MKFVQLVTQIKTRCEKRKYTKNTQNVDYEVHKNRMIKSTSDSLNRENFTHNSSLIRFILSRSGAITAITPIYSLFCKPHTSNRLIICISIVSWCLLYIFFFFFSYHSLMNKVTHKNSTERRAKSSFTLY